MSSINIITPPDFLYNQATSFLLIRPSKGVRIQFENFLKKFKIPVNVYLYDPQLDEEVDYKWLLATTKIANYTIIDIDNLNAIERNLTSYFVSLPNTFYLTNDEVTPYNMLSVNRIYNLDWLYDKLKEE
jgi:hypothetical protein